MSIADKLTTIAENEQKVYDAGRTKEWNDFWDVYQQNGNRTNYASAFAGGYQQTAIAVDCWNDNNFKPKYDIYVGANTFNRCSATNLKQRLIDCGVKIADNTASLYYAFYQSKITHIPDISKTAVTNLQNAFYNESLVSIDGITVAASCSFTNAFRNCTALEHVIFYGTIGNPLDLSWSTKLDVQSIESIITALSDTTSALTVTLPKTAKTTYYNAHSDEYADEETAWSAFIGTKPNWTISLA